MAGVRPNHSFRHRGQPNFRLGFPLFRFPDACLIDGYRRLEDVVRQRTGLQEHGAKLFSETFLGDAPRLSWSGLSAAEQSGRGALFTSAYRAYRNPRAHRELRSDSIDQTREFLLLNHLFSLERSAVEASQLGTTESAA